MIVINNLNDSHFLINGIEQPKVFMCELAEGETDLTIVKIYDSFPLLVRTPFDEIQLDGVVYTTRQELVNNLIDVIFNRSITTEIPVYERYLGVPTQDGYVLKSRKDGSRYWGPGGTGGGTGEEIDPTVPVHLKEITATQVTNWDTAFAWGNHADAGYITGITVTDDNANLDVHNIATVEGVVIKETVTKLNTPTLTGNVLSLSYINENGVEQSVTVDLSSIVTNESGISNATYDASTNIITLNEVDGDSHTINLSEFSIVPSTDAEGITTLTQEGQIKLTVSKVGQSGSFGDLLNKPTSISGYGITDAYTKAQIDARFDGTTAATGYNKSQWDQAYAWGNHAGLYTKYEGWNLQVEGVQKALMGSNDILNLIGGNNISITYSTPNAVTISGTNNYISSLSGNGNSTITIGRQGLSNITHDLSHNHDGVYEPVITKNTAFNKNFGTVAGTVAQGNDSRINNGQTAYGWGNHAAAGYLTSLPAIPDSTSDLINDSGFITSNEIPDQDNQVRVININSADLTTVDEAGVVAYLNSVGFAKYDIETIIVNVASDVTTEPEVIYTITITSPLNNSSFDEGTDITIQAQVTTS